MNPTSTLADSTLGEGAVDPAAVLGETIRGRGGRRGRGRGAEAGMEPGEGEEGEASAPGRTTALKRSTLTDAQKYEICLFLKETDDGGEEKMTHRAVTNYILHRYNVKVDTSTISRLRKGAEKRLTHESPNPLLKRHRAVMFPELEKRLTDYIESSRGETRITDAMIVSKGKELRKELAIAPELLSFSAGWLSKFKIRNGLKIKQGHTPQPQQTLYSFSDQHTFADVDKNGTEGLTVVLSPPRPMVISHGSSPGSSRLRPKPTLISSATAAEQGVAPSKKRIRSRRGVDKDAITISPRPSPSMASPMLHSRSPSSPSSPVLGMVGSNAMDQYGPRSASDISDMDMDMSVGPGIEDDVDDSMPTDHLQPTLPTLDYSGSSYSDDIRSESPSMSVTGSITSTSDRQPKSKSPVSIAQRSTMVRRGQQNRPQALLSKISRIDAELSLSPSSMLEGSVNTPMPSASNTAPSLPYTIPLGTTRRELVLRPAAAAAATPITPFAAHYVPPTPSLYIPTVTPIIARPISALPSMISNTVTSTVLPLPFPVPTLASNTTTTSAAKTANPSTVNSSATLSFATTTASASLPETTATTSSTMGGRSQTLAHRVLPTGAMHEQEDEDEEPKVDFKEAAACINTLRIFMEQQSFEMEQVHHLQQIYLTLKRKRQSSKPNGS